MYIKYTKQTGIPSVVYTKILLIMRITIVILIATLMQVSASGFAQKISLSEKNASIFQVFAKIKQQSGYDFVADDNLLKSLKPININVKKTELTDVLDLLFKDELLEYTVQNKIVVVSRKTPSLLDRVTSFFKDVDLKGLILNEKGEPMPGASILVQQTKRLYLSDESGSFNIRGLKGKETLIFSFIGYQSDTISLRNRTSLVVTLKPVSADLSEVKIVSTGYQNLNRDRATGSFGIVTAKDIAQYPTISLLERLQGLVPGVDISTKTEAGKSRNGTINIRGISTIISDYGQVSTEPLLVIDGFPSQVSIAGGALDLMNPNDIQQITFLKDAAASAIWGIKAANGVIVVTTKKGKPNTAPSINFSTTFSTSAKPKLNYGSTMSVADYIDLEKDMIDMNLISDPFPIQSGTFPGNNSQAQAIIFRQKRGEITESQMNMELANLANIDNQDQISRYLLQRPQTQQYNLSLTGGGVNSSYYMSGYYYNEDRLYKSNKNKGYAFNMGSVSSLFKGILTINANLSYNNTSDVLNAAAVRAMSQTSLGMRPYDALVNADGSTKYYDVFSTPLVARNFESKGYLPFRYSAIDELNYNNTVNNTNNIALNLDVTGKITPWLSVSLSGNLGRYFNERENYQEPESYESRIMINRATSVNAAGALVYGIPNGGRLSLANALGRSYNLRGQLSINKSWSDKHELNVLMGNEIRENFSKSSNELRYGYDKSINAFRSVNPSVSYLDIYGQRPSIGATSSPVVESTTRGLSYYASGSYTFNSKYTVSGSARFDDLNLLGVERRKRAIPLWSAGLSWNMKKEMILKDLNWLTNLSTRFTYGFTGNAPQGYAPVTVISLLGTDFESSLPYAVIDRPARENLAWEKTRMINYGLQVGLFNGRVSATVDYYLKKTTDIFFQLPINGTYGFTQTIFNAAKLGGKGVDLGLSFIPVQSKNVSWNNTINISYNTNKVHDERFNLPIGDLGRNQIYDGYPQDYLFSYKFAGLDNTGQTLIEDPKVPGRILRVDEFQYFDIMEYSGRTASPYYGAYSSNISYKQFSLGFQFQYAFGGVFRKPSVTENSVYVSRAGDLGMRWRKPGDELFTNVPTINTDFNQGYYYGTSITRYSESDYLIRSRSNIKLQQISLSYALPQKLLKPIGVKMLTVSAVCRNLGLIWTANKEKIDPDYVYNTGNTFQLAPVRSYSFQLNLSL